MTEIINTIMNWINQYYGNTIFLVMAIFAYLYLFVKDKDSRIRVICPVILIAFVVVNPILYKHIFSKVVYWRLLWMLPCSIMIAVAIVRMVQNCKNFASKLVVLGIIVICIVAKGTNVFENGGFTQPQNPYKISQDVVEVCDTILELDDNPRCIMPATLYSEVRQYSGQIEMLYGRDIDGFIQKWNHRHYLIAQELQRDVPDYDMILSTMVLAQIDCLVTYGNKPISEDLLKKYNLQISKAYSDYCIVQKKEQNTKKCIVTQYGNNDVEVATTFYTIEDQFGRLIIVDGGFTWDAPSILNIIEQYDRKVYAWILTNGRMEHMGGFNEIMSQHKDIDIEHVYAIHINDDVLTDNIEDEYTIETIQNFKEITKEWTNVTYLHENEEYELGDLKLKVISEDNQNVRGSIAFLIQNENETMLFCSDNVNEQIEKKVLEKCKNQQIDYIQLANHGNYGFSKKFYDEFEPKAVFFDISQLMLEEVSPQYVAKDLEDYFTSRKLSIFTFQTTPNRFVFE